MTAAAPPRPGADRLLALLLAIAAAAYVAAWPRHLGVADESYFLYEAQRIRAGEVMYRDFFQFVAPLAWYVMGAAFALFGTDVWTARLLMAAIHGATAAAVYLAARAGGVRRGLAAVAAVIGVALAFPIWPFASPHWLATGLCVALLWAALRLPWAARPAQAAWLGALCALLAATQQQKGAVFGLGLALLLALDALCDARARRPRWWADGLRRLAWLGGGFLLAFAPLAAAMLAAAGVAPVLDALVRYPLEEYHAKRPPIPWAGFVALTTQLAVYTWPLALRLSPLAYAVPLAGALWDGARGRARARVRRDLTLVVFGGAAAASIAYYPDAIHVGFIAPLAAVALAVSSERLLGLLPIRAGARLGVAASVLALAALARPLWDNQWRAHATWPLAHDTAFGRVHFAQAHEVAFVDALRARLDGGERWLFAYNIATPYLLADGRNPTRYQHLSPRFHRPERLQEALAALRARPPRVAVTTLLADPRADPIAAYLAEHYDVVPYTDRLTGIVLLARRND